MDLLATWLKFLANVGARFGEHDCDDYPGENPLAVPADTDRAVFVFFSNRLACLRSLVVSLLATVALVLLLRAL
jgi:hypothetical protein